MNNCKTPLELTWNDGAGSNKTYKVNRTENQTGLYVSKKVADDLLTALADLRARCMIDDPEFNIPSVNEAIDNAIKGE
jgi:hypothetical protein